MSDKVTTHRDLERLSSELLAILETSQELPLELSTRLQRAAELHPRTPAELGYAGAFIAAATAALADFENWKRRCGS